MTLSAPNIPVSQQDFRSSLNTLPGARLNNLPGELLLGILDSLQQRRVLNTLLAGYAGLVLRGAPVHTDTIELVVDPSQRRGLVEVLRQDGFEFVSNSGQREPVSDRQFTWVKDRAFRAVFTRPGVEGRLVLSSSLIRIPERLPTETPVRDAGEGSRWDADITQFRVLKIQGRSAEVVTPRSQAQADRISVERLNRLENEGSSHPDAVESILRADASVTGHLQLSSEVVALQIRMEVAQEMALRLAGPSGRVMDGPSSQAIAR